MWTTHSSRSIAQIAVEGTQNMIEVVWWNGQRGSWCQTIVEFLTEGMTHRMDIKELQGHGAIVVVKADQYPRKSQAEEFLRETAQLKWFLLIVTANEEIGMPMALFDANKLRFRKWLQTPHKWQQCDHALPWGWTPGCMKEVHSPKLWDWSFAGQITHSRREEFLKVARTMDDHQRMLVTSAGFSQGIPQEMYYKMLAGTRVAPCPSGPITVDSMRVCEALQLGAIPILDTISPTGPYPEYWDRFFDRECPLPRVTDWKDFPGILEGILREGDAYALAVGAWWQKWKGNLRNALMQDLKDLGAI
jgi:hypothetical protein